MPRGRPDADVLKALNHPVRREVMSLLAESIASPRELAERVGIPLTNMSYHVRVLRELGLIKVAEEKRRRGFIEHRYQASSRTVGVNDVIQWLLAADRHRP